MNDRKLIDAVNLLCEYTKANLRNGWTIALRFSEHRCALECIDADGTNRYDGYDVVDPDRIASDFILSCGLSREVPE